MAAFLVANSQKTPVIVHTLTGVRELLRNNDVIVAGSILKATKMRIFFNLLTTLY